MGRQDNAHSYLKQMDKPEEKQFVRQLESFKKRVISFARSCRCNRAGAGHGAGRGS
jgi:hypothetical protein